jgi:exosortase
MSTTALALLALAGLVVWVFWPTFDLLLGIWASDPQYSHGYLVPLFAGYLLWARRSKAEFPKWQTCWWGVALIAAACLVRMVAAYLAFDWLDAASLLPCLAGLAVLLGGRRALTWSWPAIAFLGFMIPLPYRLAHSLSGPLQKLATELSALTMQTVGLPAIVEGNTILLGDSRIAVVEACSGLSMLLVFAALTTAAAIVVRRPLLDRLALVLSAIPVAVVANVLRITATGVAQYTVGPRFAHVVFHDLAGWLMMIMAVGMVVLVLKLLDWLLIVPPAPRSRVPIPGVQRLGPTQKSNRTAKVDSPAASSGIIGR